MWAENLLLLGSAALVTMVMVVSWRVFDAADITGQPRWIMFAVSGFVLPLAAMLIAVSSYRSA
jgi:hypothetical protein